MKALTALEVTKLHQVCSIRDDSPPSLDECLEAARDGQLYEIGKAEGPHVLTVSDSGDAALARWAGVVGGDAALTHVHGPRAWALGRGWRVERIELRCVGLTPDGGPRPPVLAIRENALDRIDDALDRYFGLGCTLAYRDEDEEGVAGPWVEVGWKASSYTARVPPPGVLRTWRATRTELALFAQPNAIVATYSRRNAAQWGGHGLGLGESYTAETGEPVPAHMLLKKE